MARLERPGGAIAGPWRGPGRGRPPVPLPPGRMPLVRGGRPLKAWTYVGAFGPEAMVCAATVRIGVLRVAWWAIWDRASGRLVQRTARGRGGVEVAPGRLAVAGRMELALGDGEPVEVVSPHGSEYAWTRKRGGVPARGWVRLGGARREVELRAIVDESAGYHARHTAWRWSAGVGVAASGEPVAWNLVDGIHDGRGSPATMAGGDDGRGAAPSERTVWIAGAPQAVGPAAFAHDLSAVGGLRFAAEAVRERRERLLLLRSDYVQPFGTFTGDLPVAGPLREGWGVMERHEVRW